MAAYYHILTPFQISIEDNPKLEKQFLDIYGQDFILEATNRIERFSPKLPNGERLDFSYTEKIYVLPCSPPISPKLTHKSTPEKRGDVYFEVRSPARPLSPPFFS